MMNKARVYRDDVNPTKGGNESKVYLDEIRPKADIVTDSVWT